jgi:DNA-binding NarL/FixJ family response regulator
VRVDGCAGPDPAAVNAALLLRDEMLGGLSERSLGVLRGLLSGRTQREIAEKLDVSASAVSQRVRHDGLAALVASERLLGEIR